MRFRGAKQAAAYREHGPARDAFLEEFEFRCRIPGCTNGMDVAVHEIMCGKNRMRAFGVRAAWLPACGFCNCYRLVDKLEWPLPAQLALKLLIDPEYYDLDAIRRIAAAKDSDRIPQLVTDGEVIEQVRRLLMDKLAEIRER